jgi:hypothetical protein
LDVLAGVVEFKVDRIQGVTINTIEVNTLVLVYSGLLKNDFPVFFNYLVQFLCLERIILDNSMFRISFDHFHIQESFDFKFVKGDSCSSIAREIKPLGCDVCSSKEFTDGNQEELDLHEVSSSEHQECECYHKHHGCL